MKETKEQLKNVCTCQLGKKNDKKVNRNKKKLGILFRGTLILTLLFFGKSHNS
jgi:hypothetical protein